MSTTTFTNTNIIVNNGAGGSVNGNGRPIIIDGSVTVTSGLFNTGGYINQINGSIVNNDRVTLSNGVGLGGNFTNNGTFTGGANVVTLNGTAAQTIGGTASTTFGGLTINNTSGVTLAQNATVSSSLGLTAGVFTSDQPSDDQFRRHDYAHGRRELCGDTEFPGNSEPCICKQRLEPDDHPGHGAPGITHRAQ